MIGGPSNAGALFADWVRADGRRTAPPALRSRRPGGRSPRPGDPTRVPVWLPYLRGERTPFHDPDAAGQRARPRHRPGPRRPWSGRAHEASGFVIRRIMERSGVRRPPGSSPPVGGRGRCRGCRPWPTPPGCRWTPWPSPRGRPSGPPSWPGWRPASRPRSTPPRAWARAGREDRARPGLGRRRRPALRAVRGPRSPEG